MEFIYPAIFQANNDGSYTITFPDLPGCISEGKSLGNALSMAQQALTQWVGYLADKRQPIPAASPFAKIKAEGDDVVSLVRAETKDTRAVRRTVSIPRWMDDEVTRDGISLSRVLQDALSDRFLRA